MGEVDIKQLLSKNIDFIRNNFDKLYLKEFDNNIANIKIKCVHNYVDDNSQTRLLSNYDLEHNRLLLYPNNLNRYDKDNAGRLLMIDLLNIASSNCVNGDCGVNNKVEKNYGLNDGITEYFSFTAYPNVLLFNSKYLFELLLTMQLITIVGIRNISLSYFNFHNIHTIKVFLSKYINEVKVEEFFELFEQFHIDRLTNGDYSLLGKLQYILVESFKSKCNLINDNRDIINYFKDLLITPELVNKYTNKDNDIPLLRESLNRIDNMEGKRNI